MAFIRQTAKTHGALLPLRQQGMPQYKIRADCAQQRLRSKRRANAPRQQEAKRGRKSASRVYVRRRTSMKAKNPRARLPTMPPCCHHAAHATRAASAFVADPQRRVEARLRQQRRTRARYAAAANARYGGSKVAEMQRRQTGNAARGGRWRSGASKRAARSKRVRSITIFSDIVTLSSTMRDAPLCPCCADADALCARYARQHEASYYFACVIRPVPWRAMRCTWRGAQRGAQARRAVLARLFYADISAAIETVAVPKRYCEENEAP